MINVTTLDFFNQIYKGKKEGIISLWSLQSKASFHCESTTHAEELSRQLNESQEDTYFGVGLRSHDLGRFQRGSAADVIAIPGVWLDADIAGAAHVGAHYPPSLRDATELLDQFQQPTLVVDSGHGLHVYWIFDELLYFATDEDRKRGRIIVESFQKRIIEAAGVKGWKLDNTSDLARVLRVPGTINRKDPLEHKPVITVIRNDHTYNPNEFAPKKLVVVLPPKQVVLPTKKVDVKEHLAAVIPKLNKKESRELGMKALNGEPLSTSGGRNNAVNKLAGILAFLAPDASAEELLEFMRPSLEAMREQEDTAANPAPYEFQALDMIERALSSSVEKHAEDKRVDEAIKSSLLFSIDRQGKYTSKEIAAWAKEQGCTVAEFDRRWIISKGDSFYIFVDGNYQSPIRKTELQVSLIRDLASAPIQWTVISKKGEREKTTEEMLRDYSTVARKLIADLTIDRSTYVEKTQTFFEAVRPKRNIEPKFNAQIDKWLRLLGGTESEKLLDWIATIGKLTQQSCALYLSGAPGCGKTMLANGLSRIWSETGPTELKRILENFNSDLTKCPLVFADESLPNSNRFQTSTEIRAMIGSNCRTLTRKYIDNSDLVGAIRIILAANNENILMVGGEDLGPEDLEAIASRFLHVRTPVAAKEYLEALGGHQGTSTWVTGDLIAQHALHLAMTRAVTPGKRFVVEGHVTSMHNSLATQGKWPSLACEWLARYLDAPDNAIRTAKCKVICGGGEFLVNATTVADFWDKHVKSEKQPAAAAIGRALRNVSKGEKYIGKIKYRIINTDLVLDWAEKNHIGDLEAMRGRIVAPINVNAISPKAVS